MADIQNPQPGAQNIRDFSEHRIRGARTGEVAVSQVHGQLEEAIRAGQVWTISTPVAGITVTANMAVSVASANAILGLYNKSAAHYLHVLRLNLTQVTNATALGYCWGFNTPTQLATVPAGVARAKNNLTLVLGGHQAVAFDGSVAVSGAAATDYFRPITASIIQAGGLSVTEYPGDISIPPYGFMGVFSDIGGVLPVVKGSLTWEEVPV